MPDDILNFALRAVCASTLSAVGIYVIWNFGKVRAAFESIFESPAGKTGAKAGRRAGHGHVMHIGHAGQWAQGVPPFPDAVDHRGRPYPPGSIPLAAYADDEIGKIYGIN